MAENPVPPHLSPALGRVSFAGCAPFPALVVDGKLLAVRAVRPALDLIGTGSMTELLSNWAHNDRRLDEAFDHVRRSGDAIPVDAVRVHAPFEPHQIYCTIGNYRSQLIEAALDAEDGPDGAGAAARREATLAAIARRERDGEPYVCLKPSSAATGPFGELTLHVDTLDWEVEVGAVIGRTAWRVDEAQAMACVAGYCVVNDLTWRERIFRGDPKALGTDWLQCKGGAGWLPIGPWFVPARAVARPEDLRLQLRLNGTAMQDGTVGDMVFSIARQIAYLSRYARLEPGDLICTGSPAGFGSHHGRYLRPGDVVEAGIVGLGSQRVCVA